MGMKTIGVLGGMGPLATACFFQRIVEETRVDRDQDHVPVVLCCTPQISDRAAAILRHGVSPLRELTRALARLESAEPDIVCMPCNTAHYWYEELARSSTVPFLHIVDAVLHELGEAIGPQTPVGLIATDGTISAGIYPQRAAGLYAWRYPDETIVRSYIRPAIDLIKAGRSTGAIPLVQNAIHHLIGDKHAGAIVLGCTELSLVLEELDIDIPAIDSSTALARWSIRHAIDHPDRPVRCGLGEVGECR